MKFMVHLSIYLYQFISVRIGSYWFISVFSGLYRTGECRSTTDGEWCKRAVRDTPLLDEVADCGPCISLVGEVAVGGLANSVLNSWIVLQLVEFGHRPCVCCILCPDFHSTYHIVFTGQHLGDPGQRPLILLQGVVFHDDKLIFDKVRLRILPTAAFS